VKPLDQILNKPTVSDDFFNAPAAADYTSLPPGTYLAMIENTRMHVAKSGRQGFKIKFKIADGPCAGRIVWHDLWFTTAAQPYTLRDLAKLGIKNAADANKPLIDKFKCRIMVVLRTEENGTPRNGVKNFDVLERINPEPDPFAPTPTASVPTVPMATVPMATVPMATVPMASVPSVPMDFVPTPDLFVNELELMMNPAKQNEILHAYMRGDLVPKGSNG
jgi:hypothetical protein